MSTATGFSKGHGTENDFVLLLDPAGTLDLPAERVARFCDRRAGIGGDGLIRAMRDGGDWFMDYRNADGSVAEMCGNGVRVMSEFLRHTGQVSDADFAAGLPIRTRAGTKTVTRRESGWYAVNMGRWTFPGGDGAVTRGFDSQVRFAGAAVELPGLGVDLGNPHTVVVLPEPADLAALDLRDAPVVTPHPVNGMNVEAVVVHELLDEHTGHLSMRVYERGVGETRSCGTGTCAAMLAAWAWSGRSAPTRWRVDVPGGEVEVTLLESGDVQLAGPAVVLADGTTTL